MREIKFRAWDNEKKVWLTCSQLTHITSTEGGTHPTDILMMEPCEHLGNISVEQLTGLLDKNGKEIYEGDAVEWDDSKDNGFRDSGGIRREAVRYEGTEWKLGDFETLASVNSYHRLKVIGNIHENPELLN